MMGTSTSVREEIPFVPRKITGTVKRTNTAALTHGGMFPTPSNAMLTALAWIIHPMVRAFNTIKAANTADTTAEYDQNDISSNKAMAILAYLSWLVLIPLFAAKDSKFARFHTNQGLVLAIAEIAYVIVVAILNAIFIFISFRLAAVMSTIFSIASLAFLVLAILGIVNAANGKAKELPIIGKIKLLK